MLVNGAPGEIVSVLESDCSVTIWQQGKQDLQITLSEDEILFLASRVRDLRIVIGPAKPVR